MKGASGLPLLLWGRHPPPWRRHPGTIDGVEGDAAAVLMRRRYLSVTPESIWNPRARPGRIAVEKALGTQIAK